MIPVGSSSSSSAEEEEEEIDKEEQQRRLEQEMIKRRERIERWRAERKEKDAKVAATPAVTKSAKKWSLEDESEEDDSNPLPTIDVDVDKKEPDSPPSKFHSIRKRFDDDVVESKFAPVKRPTFGKVLGMVLGTPAAATLTAATPPKTTATIINLTTPSVAETTPKVEVAKEQPKEAIAEVKLPVPATPVATAPVAAAATVDPPKVQSATPMETDETAGAEPEDDVDPLDAYMQEVNKEMRRVNHFVSPAKAKGVVILTGVAKKKTTTVKKGELIEQNMDSLEYSSEDELEDIRDTAVNLAMKHRKELAKIDHSSVSYAPFRKNFYVEVPELTRMTNSEVDKYRTELEGVQVKGKGCPKPIKVSKNTN